MTHDVLDRPAPPAAFEAARSPAPRSRERGAELAVRIDRLLVAIDRVLGAQVDAIIHHRRFQRLEASWRQLHLLVSTHGPGGREAASDGAPVLVRVMDVSWRELARDAQRAAEFDQSRLFDFVYSREFDMAGGQPFGLLIGDYEVSSGINAEHGTDDPDVLEAVSAVAAAAFAPFICSAAPALLDVEAFAELDRELDMAYLRDMDGNRRWNRLRAQADSRFLGVTCPRVLVRRPYRANDLGRNDGFPYRESVSPDGSTLLWGLSAWAMAHVVLREFATSGWFADIRGVRPAGDASGEGGGLVDQYPPFTFDTDAHGFAAQPPVEIRLAQSQERMLAEYGLIPLMPLPYSTALAFNTNQSLHKVPRYDSEIASTNARIAAMLQYVLCACRFAHYLKLIMREHTGSVASVGSLSQMLNGWLARYCIGNDDADAEMKAKFPLRAASIEVRAIPGRPGVYSSVLRLQPHFQLDDVQASFQLLTDMNENTGNVRG